MNREAMSYARGKIYRLVCNTTGLQYIGSTTKKYLSNRLTCHRDDYKKWLEGNRQYITSFLIIENNNYEIILIENYPCNSKDELQSRERHYIETTDCVNKTIPTRTIQEWRKDNKNYIKQYSLEYYEKNKEIIKENHKQKIQCDCGAKVSTGNYMRHCRTEKHNRLINSISRV